MGFEYKIDILAELKKAGYSSTRLRNDGLISESAMSTIRRNKKMSLTTLETVCRLLHLQPGDVIEITDNEIED